MDRIRDCRFGHVVVDGEPHRRDVIVLPNRVVGDWWRAAAAALHLTC